MSKELTEQWRNGTLEESMYYVKLPEEIIIANIYQLKQLDLVNDADEIEVLAPVPSYDEFIILSDFKKIEKDAIDNLVKIHTEKLEKKLDIATKALKETRKIIEDFNDDPMNKIGFMAYGTLHECLEKSKQALKEMKG